MSVSNKLLPIYHKVTYYFVNNDQNILCNTSKYILKYLKLKIS